jgi:lactate permease
LFSLLVPFWIVAAMAGFKSMREVWPACLTAGLSFALTQFLVSNYHGPWIVDIASAAVSLLSLIILLRFWHPRTAWRFKDEMKPGGGLPPRHSSRERAIAWMPWVLLSVFVFLWGLPEVKTLLNNAVIFSSVKCPVPYLDKAVLRNIPVVSQPRPEDAVFTFDWLSATGTSLLLTGICSGLVLKVKSGGIAALFGGTVNRIGKSLLTIATMMAIGFTIRYAGLDATIGLAFAGTGVLFPFFSPILGWLGVALTGSDTSSNVLFGNLQQITAQTLGVSPLLAAAANSSGGVMGKMINAQSIVVAGVATGQQGTEGTILRYVFWHSIVLASLVGIVVVVQAYVFPAVIPEMHKVAALLF